jgi:hypothetical protein
VRGAEEVHRWLDTWWLAGPERVPCRASTSASNRIRFDYLVASNVAFAFSIKLRTSPNFVRER